MLPTEFQNISAISEIPASWWVKIFNEAEEGTQINDKSGPETILALLNDRSENAFLRDALATIFELGTPRGLEHLEEVAEDQGLDLRTSSEEPAREAVARLWVESRTKREFQQAIALARLYPPDQDSRRTFREFAGAGGGTWKDFEPGKIREAISKWCEENKRSGVTTVLPLRRGSERLWAIVRGDRMRREPIIRDKRMAILDFQPALSDLIRYDPETGRLGIATNTPSLVAQYRKVMGALIAEDDAFFVGENICSLRPLQEKGAELFKGHLRGVIIKIDVVELLWNRGHSEKMWVRSTDCFETLATLGTSLAEGQLAEAKFKVTLAGGGRPATVTIKVPNRIEIKPAVHEATIETLLDEVGIRGVFSDEASAPQTLWDLYPWLWPEGEWRKHANREFESLRKAGLLVPCPLQEVDHPDHPGMKGILEVQETEGGGHFGISGDPGVRSRSLTPSDVEGYQLVMEGMASRIRASLGLASPVLESPNGCWTLGALDFGPGLTFKVLWIARHPDPQLTRHVQGLLSRQPGVVLVPLGCSMKVGVPEAQVSLAQGPDFQGLMRRIVEALNLDERVSPRLWLKGSVDLIIDEQEGAAYFKDVHLTELKTGTQAWQYLVALACADGKAVSGEELRKLVSCSREEAFIRKLKSQAQNAIKASLEKAGKGDLYGSDPIKNQYDKHSLTVTSYVRRKAS